MSSLRFLVALALLFVGAAGSASAQFQSPTFQNLTVLGNCTGCSSPAAPNLLGGIKAGPQVSVQTDGTIGLSVYDRPPGPYDDSAHGFSLGRISSLQLIGSGGSNEQNATCAISAPTGTGIGTGANVQATCTPVVVGGVITQYLVSNAGQGYTGTATATVTQNGGSGATQPYPVVENPTVWNYKGTLYTPLDLTPGNAVWTKINMATASGNNQFPLIADAGVAAGAPVPAACWGMMQLYSAYSSSGSAADITRSSDSTTKTIAFLNGDFDYVTADTFVAENSAGTQAGIFTKWYEQCSGSHYDATGASPNAPGYYGNMVGSRHSLTFDSNQASNPISKYLTLPNTLSLTPQPSTFVVVARARSTILTGGIVTMNAQNLGIRYSTGSAAGVRAAGGASRFGAPASAEVYFITCSGTSQTVQTSLFTAAGTCSATGSYTDGFIGATSAAGNSGGQDMIALLYYNQALTSAQQTAIENAILIDSNLKPQARCVLIGSGDSIIHGAGVNYLRSYWNQLQEPSVNYPCRYYNNGIPGQSMTNSLTNFINYLWPEYDPNTPRFIVAIEDGVNDFINNNNTAVQVEATLQTYSALIYSMGNNVRIAVQTIPQPCSATVPSIAACPRATSAQVAQIVAYNTWLRASWRTVANALIDVDAAPLFGTAFNQNAALSFDGLHPTATGSSAYLPPYKAAIQSLLAN